MEYYNIVQKKIFSSINNEIVKLNFWHCDTGAFIMDTLTLDNETFNTINTLADQLNASPTEIVRQALNEYVEKRLRKNRLMSYAGILEEQEADAMLSSIRENRANKQSGN
jgi:predicted transcriptional regulator